MVKPIKLQAPYLVFVGNETNPTFAKTGLGIVQWRPELCLGQLRLSENSIDLGIADLTLEQALDAGVKSLIIGVASIGGGVADEWIDTLAEAASHGIDIIAGVHKSLNDVPRLREAANISGSALINVRIPPEDLPVGKGVKRTGKRILMVGTDCAVGKKYTALALEKDMKKMGLNADFRASGQTGIMIAGLGIPIDAVVSDFVSGAAELLSPDNTDDHWDIIEGQGGIFHPGYSAVSMGLLVGSQPDAFIVCHEANRATMVGWDEFKLPSIGEVIERTVLIGQVTNPEIKCVGICVNTSRIKPEDREDYLAGLSSKYGLPAVDPIINGTEPIIHSLN